LSFSVYCQTKDSSNWRKEFYFSPDFTSINTHPIPGNYIPNYGFSSGFRAIRLLDNSFGIETGISFGTIGAKTRTYNSYNKQGSINTISPAFDKYRFNFISIPIVLQKKFTKKKSSFFIGFGINYNAIFFSSEKRYINGKYYSGDGNFGFYSIFGLTAKTGVVLKINEELNLIINPSFRYQFLSLNESEASLEIQPYSAGLEIGFSKLLKVKKKSSFTNLHKNIIYIEGFGPGLFYSLNYERSVILKGLFKFNLRTGGSIYPHGEFAIPIGVNFAFGRTIKFETGIYSTFQNYSSNSWRTDIVPSIGARLESRKNLFLRIAYTPMYVIRTRETLFSFGVCIGKLF